MIAIGEITSASTALNEADDQLATAIVGIEQLLSTHIGTRVEVPCTGEKFARIAFGKQDGGWHLLVEQNGQWTVLSKASREVRACALAGGHVKRLVIDSADQIRNQVVSRRLAASAANELLALLNTSPGDKP